MSVQQCDRSHLGKLVCDFFGIWFTYTWEIVLCSANEVNVSTSGYYVQIIMPENKVQDEQKIIQQTYLPSHVCVHTRVLDHMHICICLC